MDKIETPEEFTLKIGVMALDGIPYQDMLAYTKARDALIRADERQKCADRAIEDIKSWKDFDALKSMSSDELAIWIPKRLHVAIESKEEPK